MDLKNISDSLLGPALRRIPNQENKIFLTFDDGPLPPSTSMVLEILKKHGAYASFFVIAERARQAPELIQRMIQDGHSIGNHSFDHAYSPFFSHSLQVLQDWIARADQVLSELGVESIGFRPPNGIRTPPLMRALKALNEPLILWQVRFYDAVWPWTEKKARRAVEDLTTGDIILLHDAQRPSRQAEFLSTLDVFISLAQKRGFQFVALPSNAPV